MEQEDLFRIKKVGTEDYLTRHCVDNGYYFANINKAGLYTKDEAIPIICQYHERGLGIYGNGIMLKIEPINISNSITIKPNINGWNKFKRLRLVNTASKLFDRWALPALFVFLLWQNMELRRQNTILKEFVSWVISKR